uniref:Uncharacterized protein n=1 Tax=Opuntia streptacantha TaxID=393608 RepID=A0A7C9AT61_OPUST
MVKHFPSTAISCTETASYATHISHVSSADSRYECSDPTSHVLKDIHISAQLIEDFLQIAADNTNKDLETCAVLGASLEDEKFYATTLIVPKQESTCSSYLLRDSPLVKFAHFSDTSFSKLFYVFDRSAHAVSISGNGTRGYSHCFGSN